MTMHLGLILKSSQVFGLVGTLYQNLKQNTLFVSTFKRYSRWGLCGQFFKSTQVTGQLEPLIKITAHLDGNISTSPRRLSDWINAWKFIRVFTFACGKFFNLF